MLQPPHRRRSRARRSSCRELPGCPASSPTSRRMPSSAAAAASADLLPCRGRHGMASSGQRHCCTDARHVWRLGQPCRLQPLILGTGSMHDRARSRDRPSARCSHAGRRTASQLLQDLLQLYKGGPHSGLPPAQAPAASACAPPTHTWHGAGPEVGLLALGRKLLLACTEQQWE